MAIIEIGGTLHNTEVGNVTAYANEILDQDKGKKQSQVNAETDAALEDRYTKAETYNKTQLDNMITTPETVYKDYDTYAEMEAETEHPNGAIYRVANYDGTQVVTNKYCEYSWDGTEYHLMAVRDYGIDNAPTAGSNNLVKSGGVNNACSNIKNNLEANLKLIDYRVDLDATIINIATCNNVGFILSDGTINTDVNHGYSDVISITKGQTLKLQYVATGAPFFIYCTSDGTFISASRISNSWNDVMTVTFDEDCYIKINGRIKRTPSNNYLVQGFIANLSFNEKYVVSTSVSVINKTTIKLNAVALVDSYGNLNTYYADAENHQDVIYDFSSDIPALCINKSNNIIESLDTIRGVTKNHVLLLSFNMSKQIFTGGVLLPLLNYNSLLKIDNNISDIEDEISDSVVLTPNNLTVGYVNALTGETSISEVWKKTPMIDIKTYYSISYTQAVITSASTNYGMAFYDENNNFIRGITHKVGASERGSNQKTVIVPIGAKYACFCYWNDSYIVDLPAFSLIGYKNDTKKILETRLVHDEITSQGQLNAVKRARQLTDIKWQPMFDIPRWCACEADDEESYPSTNVHFEDVFKAEKLYKGLPYSRNYGASWGYTSFMIGCDISLDTFVTAIRNNRSIVAVESAYSLAEHLSSRYSIVCAALVSYAYGLPYTYTVNMPNVDGMALVGKLVDGDVILPLENIKIGDLIHNSAHCAIITDIIKDDNNEVSGIEISEATSVGNPNVPYDAAHQGGERGGITRRKLWTAQEMYSIWSTFSIYRYGKISKIKYTPSPYVSVGDEPDMQGVLDLPVLPYMGNKFVYKVGYLPNTKLLINSSDFNSLRVKKDGVNWKYDGTTDYYDITGLTEINIQFSQAGSYTAYLCKVENGVETLRSMSCKWSVINP